MNGDENHRVSKRDFQTLLEGLDYAGVSTLLNCGNAVAMVEQIAELLQAHGGQAIRFGNEEQLHRVSESFSPSELLLDPGASRRRRRFAFRPRNGVV